MMPAGPLMVEHRLIERMITLLEALAREARAAGKVDTALIGQGVDFLRNFADHCHHGKEEKILFRALKEKRLSEAHQKVLEELEREHKIGRDLVSQLEKAKSRFESNQGFRPSDVAELIEKLATFYRRHIEKEDQSFFVPVMDYFTGDEQAALVMEILAFDQALFQALQEAWLERWEGPRPPEPPAADIQGPVETHSCLFCGYTYDPRQGDTLGHIPAGTLFEDLPESWLCPKCHVTKKTFIKNGAR